MPATKAIAELLPKLSGGTQINILRSDRIREIDQKSSQADANHRYPCCPVVVCSSIDRVTRYPDIGSRDQSSERFLQSLRLRCRVKDGVFRSQNAFQGGPKTSCVPIQYRTLSSRSRSRKGRVGNYVLASIGLR